VAEACRVGDHFGTVGTLGAPIVGHPWKTGDFLGEKKHIVLVGGGHAHIQTLSQFASTPPPGIRTTMVVDLPIAVYSGMVPGFVAGQYRREEVEIDVVGLCRKAGVDLILGRVVRVDPDGQRILMEDGTSVSYDVASFNIGSTVAGLDLPGVREHALPTRPIGRFCSLVEEAVERIRRGTPTEPVGEPVSEPVQVVVVGGGAGGVEVAFTIEQRIRGLGAPVRVRILEGGPKILANYSGPLRRRLERQAGKKGIEILRERRVESVDGGSVMLEGGERIGCDILLWVAGSRSHDVFEVSGVEVDDRGFVLIRPTLQFKDYDNLFAVGDCGTFIDFPETPKAGVYAVRQGPFVTHNLVAWLDGLPLRRYRPQGDFLTLMNLGDGSAVGGKWGLSFQGKWVMKWKDRIDREFMGRFLTTP